MGLPKLKSKFMLATQKNSILNLKKITKGQIKMIDQNEIENSNVSALIKDEIRFSLRFSKEIIRKIRVFCESFFIELNEFVINTISYYLYDIREDIESNKFDLIGSYYNVSKLVETPPPDIPHELSDEKSTINVEIPPLISAAVEDLCDKIPLAPEEFMEDIMKWSINNIVGKIKKGEFEFLDKYKDFSKIAKSIDQIYKIV